MGAPRHQPEHQEEHHGRGDDAEEDVVRRVEQGRPDEVCGGAGLRVAAEERGCSASAVSGRLRRPRPAGRRSGRSGWRSAIAPKTATPTALPRLRQNRLVAVTTPRRCQSDHRLHGDDASAPSTDRGRRRPRSTPQRPQAPGTTARAARRAPCRGRRSTAPDQGGVAEADPQVDPAGQRRRDRPADGHRREGEPGHQGAGAEHPLDVRRHVGVRPMSDDADGHARRGCRRPGPGG